MADRIWIEPGNRPRQTPATSPQPVGDGQGRQPKGFRIRLERQEGNLVAADSQDVEIFTGDDATSALLRDHKAFTADEHGVDDEVMKIAVSCCVLLNIPLDNIFVMKNGNPRQSSTRFGKLHLKRQTAEELLDAPREIRREASMGQLYRLGPPLQLDHLLKNYEVSFAGTRDPILAELAERLTLVLAIQAGQLVTIFMEVNAIDDSWKRGSIGTRLFGSSGHMDGQIISAWCQIDGRIVNLGRVVAYHITTTCPSARDFRVCGDEELIGLLHDHPVLEDMFALLVSWIIALESKDDQDVVIWPGSVRFATGVGRELSEAERKSMPTEVSQLESALKSKLRFLGIDERQELQFRAQQAVALGKKISWRFFDSEAIQQCGPHLNILAELIKK
jgi:hypothetical protein